MNKFIVNLHNNEFDKLKAQHPQSAQTLDKIAEKNDTKTKIDLKSLENETVNQIDPNLLDRLYQIANALREDRFTSYFYQLREILMLPRSQLNTILEIGPGSGIFETLIKNFEYQLTTLDINLDFQPDIRGNMLQLPIRSQAFDLICAFEVFEHLPYRYFQPAMQEIARASKRYVFMSFPCPTNSIHFNFKLAFLQRFWRKFSFHINRFQALPTQLPDKNEAALLQREDLHNPHYWEVNRKSYPKNKVLDDISNSGLNIIKTFHNPHYPYHFFVLCQVRS